MEKEFLPAVGNGKQRRWVSKYRICSKIGLSAAIRYFAGGDPYDIMLTHGISDSGVYTSIWGVIDCVNRCKSLAFRFPNHEEKTRILRGFKCSCGD